MNTLVKEYQDQVAQGKKLIEMFAPYRDRFYDFIVNNDTKGYLDVEPSEQSYIHGKDYDLIMDSRTEDKQHEGNKGVLFLYTEIDYDYSVDRFFYIPFEYMEDPEAWEKSFLHKLEDDALIATKAFYKVFPGLEETVARSNGNLTVSSAGYLDDWAHGTDGDNGNDYLHVKLSFEKRRNAPLGYSFVYDDIAYNSSSILYHVPSDQIILSRNIPTGDKANEAFILNHALTREEADDLPRSQAKIKDHRTLAPDAVWLGHYTTKTKG